jgi:hypothetical protein
LYSGVAFVGIFFIGAVIVLPVAVLFYIASLGCRMLLLILLDAFLPAALMAGACS